MKLHDIIVEGDYEILRVVFGWVYTRMMGANPQTSVFVPFNAGVDRAATP